MTDLDNTEYVENMPNHELVHYLVGRPYRVGTWARSAEDNFADCVQAT